MKRFCLLITLLALAAPLYAQRTASNPLGAQLNVQDAGTCSTTNSFAWQTLPTNAGTTTVNLAGTFSGTVTIRLSNNGGASWTTNTTVSSVGTTSIATNGFTDVCADVTTFTSGVFQVTITTGLQQVQSVVTVQGSGGLSTTNAITPQSFNAKAGLGNFVGDAQWGNSSQNITFPNSDGNFTSADINDIDFFTNCTAQINFNITTNCTVQGAAPGTITAVNSANSIQVSQTSSGACTASSSVTCNFGWAPQVDDAAITSAETAAYNTPRGPCNLKLSGIYFVSSPHFNGPGNNRCWQGATGSTSIADLFSVGPLLSGDCSGCAVIVLYNFNLANCTFGTTGNTCFGSLGSLQTHDFSVTGLGQPVGGSASATLWQSVGSNGGGACDGGVAMWNMAFSLYGFTDSGSVGLSLGANSCNNSTFWNINVSSFGASPLSISTSAGTLNLKDVFAWGGTLSTVLLSIGNGAVVNCFGCQDYGPFASNQGVFKCTGTNPTGKYNSWGSSWGFANTSFVQFGVLCNTGSQLFSFENDNITLASTSLATSRLFVMNGSAGNTVHLKNNIINATGTNNQIFLTNATEAIYDDGGNVYSLGTVQGSVAGTFAADGHSVKGTCTGTATASSTLALRISGAGTAAGNTIPTTCTSTTLDAGFPSPGIRTLMGLVVNAGTGGVNASSGVVTVLKNGAATTITCTLGTGTNCADFTHSVATADGDLISLQFTTQAADTLANVKAIGVWQ